MSALWGGAAQHLALRSNEIRNNFQTGTQQTSEMNVQQSACERRRRLGASLGAGNLRTCRNSGAACTPQKMQIN